MKSYALDQTVRDICARAVVISGSARSGTTIAGKLIHSFERVEYAFEPPVFFSLFALMDSLAPDQWSLLYETYLYEEFLINALAGRNLNCNQGDDSSIFRVKSQAEVNRRQAQSLGKQQLESNVTQAILAYKMPDIVALLPALAQRYPHTKIIAMLREPVGVFNSLLAKGWYSNSSLQTQNLIWPCRMWNELRIPFWVGKDDESFWLEADELHRIAYYYVLTTEPLASLPSAYIVDYADLLQTPSQTASRLAEFLGTNWGEKTEEIVQGIRPTTKDRDRDVVNKLSPAWQKRVESAWNHACEIQKSLRP